MSDNKIILLKVPPVLENSVIFCNDCNKEIANALDFINDCPIVYLLEEPLNKLFLDHYDHSVYVLTPFEDSDEGSLYFNKFDGI